MPRPAPVSEPQATSRLAPAGLAAILTAYSLPVMCFFALTVALDAIQTDLGADPAILQLIIATFGVAYASTVVLGDNIGRRRMMQIGLIAMIVGSVICALAPGAGVLLGGRLLQGIAAALLAPQVLSIIQSTTAGDERVRAMSWFGAMAGIATCAAFLIGGGLLATNLGGLGWRLIFWLNVPVAAAALLALRFVPESRGDARSHLDVSGAIMLTVAVVLFVLPLTEGRAAGWPLWTWVCLAASIPAFAIFLSAQRRAERRGTTPLLPPSILSSASMKIGLLIALAFFSVFGGFMFIFALVAAQNAHLGPLGIGLTLGPFAAAFLLTSLLSSAQASRDGVALMRRGAVLSAIGYAAYLVPALSTWPNLHGWQLAIPGALAGAGQAWLMVPLFGTVLSAVPANQAGVGSGLLLTTMQMGLGVGSALVGTIFLSTGGTGSTVAPLVIALGIVIAVLLGIAALLGRLREANTREAQLATAET
ncbi:MFS transporter [Epidermidibacterium keratini]|uniref:MFS transporter n=1 Tax=Epidermidibacterium keratini TaxID=1891644 RepID=A0A7L4YPR9_9ACTN|nr:MFS transporter [Epidermidibacterium keratini]QHC01156.1 MFS transporter [Epidermidibacterium keratini]